MNDQEELDLNARMNHTIARQWQNVSEENPALTGLFSGEVDGNMSRRAFRNALQRMREKKGIDIRKRINDIKM